MKHIAFVAAAGLAGMMAMSTIVYAQQASPFIGKWKSTLKGGCSVVRDSEVEMTVSPSTDGVNFPVHMAVDLNCNNRSGESWNTTAVLQPDGTLLVTGRTKLYQLSLTSLVIRESSNNKLVSDKPASR